MEGLPLSLSSEPQCEEYTPGIPTMNTERNLGVKWVCHRFDLVAGCGEQLASQNFEFFKATDGGDSQGSLGASCQTLFVLLPPQRPSR